jgi:hypothetical protein
MMTDLDQIVRESFADQATEAPDGADLLHRVRHRDRQLTVRRRLMAGGVAAALAGVATTSSYALTTDGGSTGASVLTAPTPDGTAPPTPHLKPATAIAVPDIPLSAGWLPANPTGTYATADYLTYTFGDALPDIRISVSADDPRLDGGYDPATTTVTVGGRPATLSRVDRNLTLSLIWERRIGQWVTVAWVHRTKADAARAATDRDTLIRVTENLRDQPVAATAPFRLQWQPRNAKVIAVGATYVHFTLSGRREVTVDREFTVDVGSGRSIPHGFSQATAGRWHGSVGLEPAGAGRQNRTFYALLDHGRTLMVTGPKTALNEQDILALAAGVTYLGR